MTDRKRPWWRSSYVVIACAVLFAAGAMVVGSTFASFSAETDNNTSTFAGGWIGTPSTITGTASGYDASLTWTPATHGLTGQQLYSKDNGTSSSCSTSGYSGGPTMSSATTSSYTQSNSHATTTLSAAITLTTATSLTVASSAGFPATPFTIVIDSEQMSVTAESGVGNTTWTVTRHTNSTTATLHASGAGVTYLTDPYNGHYYCYEMVSTSASNWTATGTPTATLLGLVPTNITITNNNTSGTIDKTDVIVLTFNQQTNYPTSSQTVNVCSFTSGVVILGDGNSCAANTDGYSIGAIQLNGGTIGSADTWASSTAIESSSAPWTITVTLGASGSSHKSVLTSPTTWTYFAGTSLLTAAVTDRASACSRSAQSCAPTTSGGGF